MKQIGKTLVTIGLILSILVISSISGCVKPQPQYTTESYTEPVYGSIYYGTLTHVVGHWYGQTFETENYDNAVSIELDVTGTDARGSPEYTITITDFKGQKIPYYQKSYYTTNEKPGIIRYDQKTRQVCIANCN